MKIKREGQIEEMKKEQKMRKQIWYRRGQGNQKKKRERKNER